MAGPPPHAVDIQARDSTQLDGKSCVDYAHDRAKEYGAALRFIGLLAGVGADQDIKDARALFSDVLSKIVQTTGEENSINKHERDFRASEQARNAASRSFGDALKQYRSEIDAARDLADAQGRNIGGSLAGWLASDPNVPSPLRSAAQGVMDAGAQHDVMRAKDAEMVRKNREALARALSSLWSGIKERYHAAIAAIQDGTWKQGLCKLGVDAGFLIIETAIGVALAAALTPAVAAAIKIVSRVVEKGSALVRISVRAQRVKLPAPKELGLDKTFKRPIDTSKELTEAEKKVLGAENQGNTRQTPDAGKTEAKGAATALSKKKIGDAAEAKAREDLKKQGFTDVAKVENKSGNGIDIVGRNPQTGEVKVVEVKANGSSLNGLQARGGPDNTERVLNTAEKSKANTWKEAKGDVANVREWLQNSPNTIHQIWKYEVDAATGVAKGPRVADWGWKPGEKPKRLKFRDAPEASQVEPPKPSVAANPPTGPPKRPQD
jgi:Holliday junction resolvase-like predicted endonuclease